jgi:AmmeMemoRadiSam system protein B
MIRPPAVAGRFYPEQPTQLNAALDKFLVPAVAKKRALACMVPHAGYMYSGAVAGQVYRRLIIPECVILIGPRHYPRGAALAINSRGVWRTPLGDAPIDERLADKLMAAFPLSDDAVAHSGEHSLEVQLPFLQRLAPAFSFVPIVIGPAKLHELQLLGSAIAAAILEEPRRTLIIASSDMNHYESDEITRVKDAKAIEPILQLDPARLFSTVQSENISMCGYAATVAMLAAARALGGTRAELAAYATSGDINGDHNEVVGYAGIIID